MTITVRIPASANASANADTASANIVSASDEYVEIDFSYLKHLHKSFVKTENISGGFISHADNFLVILRILSKRETITIKIEDEQRFFIKNNDPNYNSLRDIKIERSKIEFLLNNKK